MYKQILLCLVFFVVNIHSAQSKTNFKKRKIKTENIATLNWELKNDNAKTDRLFWNIIEDNNLDSLKEYTFSSKSKSLNIRSLGKSVEINGKPYPEISNYVNNAFVESPNKFITSSLRAAPDTVSPDSGTSIL